MDTTTPAPMAPDVALATLNQRKADSAFVARYLGGDTAAKAEMNLLHERAYPDELPARHASPEAQAAAAARGTLSAPSAPQPDGQPAAPIEDDGFNTAPATPSAYQLDYPFGTELPPAVDSEIRGLFHSAGLPESFARHLFREGNALKEPPTEGQLALQASKTKFEMIQKHGEAGYAARVAAADSVINSIPDPGDRQRASDYLKRTGLANNLHILERFADLGEYRARKGA